MSFIDDEHRCSTLQICSQKQFVQGHQPPRLGLGGTGNFEFIDDRFEEFIPFQQRVLDDCGDDFTFQGRKFRVKDAQKCIEQSCLACTYWPGHHQETFTMENDLDERKQSAAVGLSQMEKFRIRSESEWLLLQVI